jgi:purine nucleosidase
MGGASVLVHLDTDLGNNPDDACALAMLLGWPGADLVGVTTTIDPGGLRAGCATYLLELAGRADIPLAAGAERSLTTRRRVDPLVGDQRYWPSAIVPRPSPPGAALDLLAQSITRGASVVATGPFTNLALLELAQPGSLARTPIVIMGGWVAPPADGLPPWGPEADWNVQCDARAAQIVIERSVQLTLTPLPVTLKAHLRAADLTRLRSAGALGELLARQSVTHSLDAKKAALGRACAALPDDLLNFHHDPVTCAVALGWEGAAVGEMHLAVVIEDGVMRMRSQADGLPMRVLTDLDGHAFSDAWLSAIETASRGCR